MIKDIFSKKNYDRLRKKYEPILLEEDKIVKCRNMGTFYLKKYENRKGRNHITGEIFPIEPYYRPILKFPDAIYNEFKERDRKEKESEE